MFGLGIPQEVTLTHVSYIKRNQKILAEDAYILKAFC
jgi:hypothetical protein